MKSDLDALMRARHLDALLVIGSADHNPPMHYFTGGAHVSRAVLFKKPGQPPVLYCNSMEREEAGKSGLKILPLGVSPMQELTRHPKAIFEEQGITSGRVGIYGEADASTAVHLVKRLGQDLPGILLVGEERDATIFQYAMETKEDYEVARIRNMGRVTTEVVGLVAEYLTSRSVGADQVLLHEDGRPLTVGDVKTRIGLWLAEQGAVDVEGCIFAIGRDAGIPHSVGDPADLVRLGQTIVFDIFPAEAGGGYFYDFTRTWSLGYAQPEAKELFNQVKQVYDEVVENLGLNVGFKEYNRLVCERFAAAGHNTPLDNSEGLITDGYVHSLGHGVGLYVHGRPFSGPTASDDNQIIAGAVFTIEPGLYYPDKGMGVRLEDTYWVRPDGEIERLADYPYDFVLDMKTWRK